MGAQTFEGRTPRGREVYREMGTGRRYVRVRVDDGQPSTTVRDLHARVFVGRFGSFSEAARFIDGTRA